jgi:hypothetical protein
MWGGEVRSWFNGKILFRDLPGGTEEKNEITHFGLMLR